jgi:autotransporter-associated beta strand protein
MKNKIQLLELSILTLLLPNAAQANINTWNQLVSGDASGSWNTAANPPWSTGAVPGGTDTADLSTLDLTADSTVTLDSNQSINSLIFGDTTTATAAGWILSAGTPSTSSLTLAGTTPTITVNALGSGKAATISADLAGTAGLTKAGAGTLILSGTTIYTGATVVNGGRLSLQDTSSNTLTGNAEPPSEPIRRVVTTRISCPAI